MSDTEESQPIQVTTKPNKPQPKPMMDIAPRPQVAQAVNEKRKLKFGLGPIKKLLTPRVLAIVALVVFAAAPSLYFYHQNQVAQARINDPNTASQEVVNEVVKKVSKLIILPSGEQPTLATVSDVSKVKGQAFFQNAQNGDKVLVFTQARKAILYRPSKNIIVGSSPT